MKEEEEEELVVVGWWWCLGYNPVIFALFEHFPGV